MEKGREMQVESKAYRELFTELSEYERHGVPMSIDGESASPMQIAEAHMIKEDSSYMRDYIWDEDGNVEELHFHELKSVE